MGIKSLIKKYQEIFSTTMVPRIFFAPGRINLIGEHIDYNGGLVLPASISLGTYALGIKRKDKKIRLYSLNFPHDGIIECDLRNLNCSSDNWTNYPKGMIKYMREYSSQISTGVDVLFYGNIPNSSGLSSSASIEIVTGVLLDNFYNLEMDRITIIKIGQKIENEYIGIDSGIMDQFAIGKGKKDHAILLDCQTLNYKYVPIRLENHVFIIINTNKERKLSRSKYNERRNQCEEALINLQFELKISALGDLTREKFEQYKYLIKDKINLKRAKHAVYENARTSEAFQALQQNDLKSFGQLMNESHISLQQDYEVTGRELDIVVQAAWNQDGVLGARMTGAGFGGCALALVDKNEILNFKKNVNQIYLENTDSEVTFYTAVISGEPREIIL